MKTSKLFLAAAAVAALASQANAAIYALSLGSAAFPVANEATFTTAGTQVVVNLWGKAQGTGYSQATHVGVFQSTSASWAGGLVSASNPFPGTNALVGVSSVYNANIANVYSQNRDTTVANFDVANAGTLPFSTIGGANLSQPSGAITAANAVLISTLTLSIPAGTAPGTYYLYLGRVGSGINESPVFQEASGSTIGTTSYGANTNTTRFGFGDAAAVATNSTGTAANTLSTGYDFAITVVPEPTSLSMLGLGALGLMSRRRKA